MTRRDIERRLEELGLATDDEQRGYECPKRTEAEREADREFFEEGFADVPDEAVAHLAKLQAREEEQDDADDDRRPLDKRITDADCLFFSLLLKPGEEAWEKWKRGSSELEDP